MQSSEALKVLALLAGYYPAANWADETLQLWSREILGYDMFVAGQAVRDLARNQSRSPSLSELLDACKAAELRVRTQQQADKRLAEGDLTISEEQKARNIEQARKLLAKVGRAAAPEVRSEAGGDS